MRLKHPPFQFHIRTLFVLTTNAAIACAISKTNKLDGLWLGLRIIACFFSAIQRQKGHASWKFSVALSVSHQGDWLHYFFIKTE